MLDEAEGLNKQNLKSATKKTWEAVDADQAFVKNEEYIKDLQKRSPDAPSPRAQDDVPLTQEQLDWWIESAKKERLKLHTRGTQKSDSAGIALDQVSGLMELIEKLRTLVPIGGP